ncbi:MAG: glycosyltransferase family 39 protein [Nitrososphaerota archaeon]|nr:glycosyltransferase family 39 protein [Candidatus Bathyarchaeota archaeon]MDW8049196.1 glycosyltransferase family 39 protein [Nitrososphaerota archaeon]
MTSEEYIKELMARALPHCPFCGSDMGYDVLSVIKGVVQCRSCMAQWSSRDFFNSSKIEKLKVRELPKGSHTITRMGRIIKRYDEYPVSFWRSLSSSENRDLSFVEGKLGFKQAAIKAILILLIAILPRILLIDETSIMTDEPLYVNTGRLYVQSFLKLDFSTQVWRQNAEHPPIAKLWTGLFSLIFLPFLGGYNTHNLYYAARIAPVSAGTLISLSIYLYGRRCLGERSSFLAAILTAVSPWLVYYSTLSILDIFAALFVTLTFIALAYARVDNRHFVLVGIFLGLAVGSKGTAAAAIPGIALYLLIVKIISKYGTESREQAPFSRIIMQVLLTPLIAFSVFFITWPWLWTDTVSHLLWVISFHLGHMESGHAMFYAGNFYTQVPAWVPFYIIFVKSPLLILILSICFCTAFLSRLFRRKRLDRGWIAVFSWLVGGVLAMTSFRIIIGDHYVLFLCPAIILSASLFAVDIWDRARVSGEGKSWKHILPRLLILAIIIECSAGLLMHWASPCGYANELILQADKAVLIIDTGFEDVAEYLANYAEKGVRVAVAYSTSLFETELQRKGVTGFQIVDIGARGNAKYAVLPSIYTQRYGIPSDLKNWTLIYTARSGQTILCYLYRAPA